MVHISSATSSWQSASRIVGLMLADLSQAFSCLLARMPTARRRAPRSTLSDLVFFGVHVNVNLHYSQSCPTHDEHRPRLLQFATLEEEQ